MARQMLRKDTTKWGTPMKRIPLLLWMILSTALICANSYLVAAEDLDVSGEDVETALHNANTRLANEAFLAGVLRRERGDWTGAAQAFKRAVALDPDQTRARLELARLLFHMGRYQAAERAFEEVLERKPPQAVRDNVTVFLEEIAGQRRRVSFSGGFGTGAFYNDNVNLGVSSERVRVLPFVGDDGGVVDTVRVGPLSRAREAFGVFGYGAVVIDTDLGQKGMWSVYTRLDGYRNVLDRSRDEEIGYYGIAIGPQLVSEDARVRSTIGYELAELGDDPLMEVYAAEPLVAVGRAGGWRWVTGTRLEYRDYVEDVQRDSVYEQLSIRLYRRFFDRRLNTRLSTAAFYESARFPVYSNFGLYPTVRLELSATRKWTLHAEGKLKRKWYDLRPPLSPEDRRDDRVQAAVGCRRRLWRAVDADLTYQYTENMSTFDLYDYTRNLVTLSLLTRL